MYSYFSCHRHEVIGGREVNLHSFLPLALDGSKMPARSFGRFTPEERTRLLIERKAGQTLVPAPTFWGREKSLASSEI